MAEDLKTVTIEGAQIIFRNFSGNETQYNDPGERNFAVILTDEIAEKMAADGWNVKLLKQREEDEGIDSPTPYLKVKVSYKHRPPKIVVITSSGRTNIDEDTVGTLDWAEFRNVDLIVNPYAWSLKTGKNGIAAYLKTMFVEIEEDDLERKYGGVGGGEG